MRKMPVGLVMDADELERQVWHQLVDHQARTTVAGVDHDPQRAQRCMIHIARQVIDVRRLVCVHVLRR